MLGLRNRTDHHNVRLLAAIDSSLATIEFDATGKIVAANRNFCQLMGYEAAELTGKHHRIFVDEDYAQSAEYREFWTKLASRASMRANTSA